MPITSTNTMPSAGRMALNAARAAYDVAKGAANGRGLRATDAEVERRAAVCALNACGKHVAGTDRCAHPGCGCWLKVKRWFAAQRCPDGRW